jgi:hypothetical protein
MHYLHPGRKDYTVTDSTTTAPQCWILYRRPDRPGWLNRLLIAPEGRRYHVAHNGSRLARNNDTKRLARRNPAVMAWVVSTLASQQWPTPTRGDAA